VGGGVIVGPGRTRLGAGHALVGVDHDVAHQRKIEQDPAVTCGEAGEAVPAAAHGQQQSGVSREVHGGDDIIRRPAPRDHGRPLVDRSVPDRARFVVVVVVRHQRYARESRLESLCCSPVHGLHRIPPSR